LRQLLIFQRREVAPRVDYLGLQAAFLLLDHLVRVRYDLHRVRILNPRR
jgi:hypothetical protein